jgi:predicted TIM-barrel fold metal-dependent hydrolase
MFPESEKFISADGHVLEPGDLWVKRMDRRFRGRAPHLERGEEGDTFYIEDLPPLSFYDLIGGMANEKVAGRPIEGRIHNRESEMRPGALDPVARLLDQDLDNVKAEVVYPNLGLFFYLTKDPEYRRECIRVYNEWLAEYCAAAPGRLLGVAMLPLGGPPEWLVDEVERAARMGLRSVMLPTGFPRVSYNDAYYRRAFEILQETGMPLAIHNGGNEEIFTMPAYEQTGSPVGIIESKLICQERALCHLLSCGVLQTLPKLQVVMAEAGIGWVAAMLRLIDHWWEDHHRWAEPRLDEPPSLYCKRQVWFTFEDDRPGLLTRECLNIDHLMWGSDYPHTEGTFPVSRQRIEKDFADLPAEVARKLVVENAARLYGIE